MDRALSAPGKLFLAGEYAVLWGGVARIVAVGPRNTAHLKSRADRTVEVLLASGKLSGQTTPVGGRWKDKVSAEFRFAATAIDIVLRAEWREATGFSVALSPSPVAPTGQKLGLGSSARAAVLATEAARYAIDGRFDTLKTALLVHAIAQDGRGSGGDVAAIFAGGLVRYRRYDVAPLVKAAQTGQLMAALNGSKPVDVARVGEPAFPMLYVFTGASSSTAVMTDDVERRVLGAERQRFVDRSDSLGAQMEEGLIKGDFSAVTEACQGMEETLARLGPLETEATDQILRLAKSYGCTGKMSGAGGGDGCVIIAPDVQRRDALMTGLTERKFFTFPLKVESGLRGEVSADTSLLQWFT
jgi:phosphomevalonate kinase